MNPNPPNDWLLRFSEPQPDHLNSIRGLLEQLPVCGPERAINCKGQAGLKGTLETVMESLARSLNDDFREVSQDASEHGYGFDYVVTQWQMPGPPRQSLEILTRLYDLRGDKANIYYGREVMKIGEDHYILWDDK